MPYRRHPARLCSTSSTPAGCRMTGIVVVVGCGLHRATTRGREGRLWPASRRRPASRSSTPRHWSRRAPTWALTARGTPDPASTDTSPRPIWSSTVGVVEPHLYAGFSGGVKGVAIGCAGEPTIAWTHRPAFIDEPGVALGRLDGNPFQQTLREIAAQHQTPLRRQRGHERARPGGRRPGRRPRHGPGLAGGRPPRRLAAARATDRST